MSSFEASRPVEALHSPPQGNRPADAGPLGGDHGRAPAALPRRRAGRRPSGPESGHRARSRERSWHKGGEARPPGRPFTAPRHFVISVLQRQGLVRGGHGHSTEFHRFDDQSHRSVSPRLTHARPSVRAVALARHRWPIWRPPPASPDLSRRSVPRFRGAIAMVLQRSGMGPGPQRLLATRDGGRSPPRPYAIGSVQTV